VLGFKGLERRAVVLVLNEETKRERSRERLYVGLSRARDQLVVCGIRTSSVRSEALIWLAG
jgi:ATP-dependent exoDNAse (exonuclease V) beta subunit